MTTRLPFTEHSLRRAIAAARKSGLRVLGVRPDGTVIVDDGNSPHPLAAALQEKQHAASSKWEDVEA